jgi:hypothetical protein
MKAPLRTLCVSLVAIIGIFNAGLVSAQTKTPQPAPITFNSFTGIYRLSRDSRGLSLLTTEETILADFPGSNSFYGITRTIPLNFQDHSLNVKVLNVSDAAGNIVPYKTSKDKNGNLVITTGDPNITLYGSQTIKIRYQTTGVVNLNSKSDEFLLNVNGRGWNQVFNRVDATVYIPAIFQASLKSQPVCYLVLNITTNNNCQINVKKSPQQTIITSRAQSLQPHQALVLKMEFKPSTFTNKHPVPAAVLIAISATLILLGSVSLRAYKKTLNAKLP